MKGPRTYYYHQDPGHGWLAVKLADLEALGIRSQISGFSYVNGKTAYLEEDRDMGIFLWAYSEVNGEYPKILARFTEHSHHIRKYQSYRTEV